MNGVNRLGVAALIVAIVAAVVGVATTPVELALQLQGGSPFSSLVFAVGGVVTVLAVVGLILGLVALQRPFSRSSASAAIGIATYLLVGQVVALVALVTVQLL